MEISSGYARYVCMIGLFVLFLILLRYVLVSREGRLKDR